jgi:signal peptidase I
MGEDVPPDPLTTEPAPPRVRRKPRVVREYVEALLVAILFATFARTFLVQAFRIPTGSMRPNLVVGDHLLVNKFVYGPTAFAWEHRWLPMRRVERGDVVVFRYPLDLSRDFIKRCVGIPGEQVRLAAKRLYVDGTELAEPYVRHADPTVYPDSPLLDDYYRRRDNFGPLDVPDGHCFFLGDNRDLSNDSRFWGTVPLRLVKGKAWRVYWSVEPASAGVAAGPRWKRLAGRTRWQRTLLLVP